MSAVLEKPATNFHSAEPHAVLPLRGGNGFAPSGNGHDAPFVLPKLFTEVAEEPYPLPLNRAMVATLKEAGYLDGLRYQHFNGRILVYPMQSNFHKDSVAALLAWLYSLFGCRFVQVDGGLELPGADGDTGNPQPDVAVSTNRTASYPGNTIPANDILLACEVAYTSLEYDIEEKALLYARAGIADYWVVDIKRRQLLVHREPVDGAYTHVVAYAETERIAPLAQPEAALLVAELLPPVATN